MHMTINVHQFRQAFIDMDRKENFSYDGLTALFEFFEEMAEGTGQEVELNVIAICCDFHEMGLDEILSEYPDFFDKDEIKGMNRSDLYQYIVNELNDHTLIIPLNNMERIIFQAF